MKRSTALTARLALATIVAAGVSSCANMDGVSVSGSVGVGMYYGSGYYDPWYYGPGYGPPVVVVPPRPERPVRPVRPDARPMPVLEVPSGCLGSWTHLHSSGAIGRFIMLPRRLVGVAVALVLAGGGAHGSR